MKAPALVGLLCFTVLAGFADSGGEGATRPIQWDRVLEVDTTADEPWEYRGFIRIGWGADAFAIHDEAERDLPAMGLRVGDRFYSTENGMGWIVTTRAEVQEQVTLSPRFLFWDLRALVEGASKRSERQDGDDTVVTASGTVKIRGEGHPYDLTIRHRGSIVAARLEAPAARESPFTFRPSDAKIPFPLTVPKAVLAASEAQQGTAQSRDQHAFLIGLIQSHTDRPGQSLPDRVTAEDMRVELLASGRSWPANAFDGSPLRSTEASGHFRWTKCGAEDGRYEGFGWDGVILSQNWGRGCAPAS
jgi:hypothetical protein